MRGTPGQPRPCQPRYRRLLAMVAVVLAAGTVTGAAAGPAVAEGIVVTGAVFTRTVTADRKPGTALAGPVRGAPVLLWTEVQADRAALDRLRTEGRLPLYHLWGRVRGVDVDSAHPEIIDRIPLGLGTTETLAGLETELATGGRFTWRTWSGKTQLAPGLWSVTVVDARGQTVTCGTGPCRFTLRLEH